MSTVPSSINEYLRRFASELGDRILKQFPPLVQSTEVAPPALSRLRRKPYPAQALAILGIYSARGQR